MQVSERQWQQICFESVKDTSQENEQETPTVATIMGIIKKEFLSIYQNNII